MNNPEHSQAEGRRAKRIARLQAAAAIMLVIALALNIIRLCM